MCSYKHTHNGAVHIKQAHGEIGGGNEATISQPFPAKGFFVLPK
jgi:hypothetical protein|tara:strand:+ start:83 stop:214 length:132 start_codon:yes stop_codon:yes gene_type:complete